MASVAYLVARRTDEEEPTTATLVTRALSGDSGAHRALYDRYRSMVNQTAARVALTHADADELAQDAFAMAFERLHRLREPAAFGGWVRSIVVRSAAKRLRRHRVARKLGLAEPVSLAMRVTDAVSRSAPPDAVVELERVYAALAELPGDAGVALCLQRVEGLTLREIAAQLGVSEPTVKRRIKRALDALREGTWED